MVVVLPLGHCDLANQHATIALSRDRGRSKGRPEKETTGESKVELPKMIVGGIGKKIGGVMLVKLH